MVEQRIWSARPGVTCPVAETKTCVSRAEVAANARLDPFAIDLWCVLTASQRASDSAATTTVGVQTAQAAVRASAAWADSSALARPTEQRGRGFGLRGFGFEASVSNGTGQGRSVARAWAPSASRFAVIRTRLVELGGARGASFLAERGCDPAAHRADGREREVSRGSVRQIDCDQRAAASDRPARQASSRVCRIALFGPFNPAFIPPLRLKPTLEQRGVLRHEIELADDRLFAIRLDQPDPAFQLLAGLT